MLEMTEAAGQCPAFRAVRKSDAILQMAGLEPRMWLLDETDRRPGCGRDEAGVSDGSMACANGPGRGFLVDHTITTLLDHIQPDVVQYHCQSGPHHQGPAGRTWAPRGRKRKVYAES